MDDKAGTMLVLYITVLFALLGEHAAQDESTEHAAQDKLTELNATIQKMARQMMLDEWYGQENVRSQGGSGIKEVRHQSDGTRPYYTETHTGSGVASIHDHGDTIRSMGMGEVNAVLNGINFRTRHNDYLLNKPHSTSTDYHAAEEIPFPKVPSSVLKLSDVQDQITEMKEYFRAWSLQDTSIRDYKPYFKPLLAYMEGAWTFTGEKLDEPFPGERHRVEAATWRELEEKELFTAYTGTKNGLENLAFLPRSVIDVNETGPVFAQWNYRIMCHPLENDLGTDRFRVVDDLASRMVSSKTLDAFARTREARFTLHPTDEAQIKDKRYKFSLLDKLMQEVPGKDNYQGLLYDESFGSTAYKPDVEINEKQNTAFYHHISKYDVSDAMGMNLRHRGFSDEALFMSMTTQEKVAGRTINNCYNHLKEVEGCDTYHQKWTYAIPLEVVYLTPLANWNPYEIDYHGWENTDPAKRVMKGGRDGTYENPYDGTNSVRFFRTPTEFFANEEHMVRPADTTGSAVYVLDKNGEKHKVRASGLRIFIPNIEGAGILRQRYPIMPVYGEGSSAWKELDALKDLVLDSASFKHMYNSAYQGGSSVSDDDNNTPQQKLFWLSPSISEYYFHKHSVEFTSSEKEQLKEGKNVDKVSSSSNGHKHRLKVKAEKTDGGAYKIKVVTCDENDKCWDGHGPYLSGGYTPEWEYVDDVQAWLDNKETDPPKKAASSATQLKMSYAFLILVSTVIVLI